MFDNSNIYWLWLSLSCTASLGNELLESFHSPYAVFKASDEQITGALKGRVSSSSRLFERDLSRAQRIMDYCFLHHIGILSLGSPDYPAALKQIEDPPLVLYYKGRLFNFDKELSIAVVGTRTMTDYGEKAAFTIASELATAGAVVVSGLALGIDSVASAAALAAGGKTVAVLGSGVDRIYPAEHALLASRITEKGLLISEYPPSSPPERFHFPERNRIISGLSAGTLLVEGGEKSGALITANLALSQGRKVFAVPGNIDSPNSFAGNYLIRNGAKAVTSADDIFDSFTKSQLHSVDISNLLGMKRESRDDVLSGFGVFRKLLGKGRRSSATFEIDGKKTVTDTYFNPRTEEDEIADMLGEMPADIPSDPLVLHNSEDSTPISVNDLPEEQAAIYSAIDAKNPMTADEIAVKASLPMSQVLTSLILMEVSGHVMALAGGRYIKLLKK